MNQQTEKAIVDRLVARVQELEAQLEVSKRLWEQVVKWLESFPGVE